MHGHDRLIAELWHCHPMCTEMEEAVVGFYRRCEAARLLGGWGRGDGGVALAAKYDLESQYGWLFAYFSIDGIG